MPAPRYSVCGEPPPSQGAFQVPPIPPAEEAASAVAWLGGGGPSPTKALRSPKATPSPAAF
ncbi:MAG: hypothetical protein JNJ88_07350 [Planctomycetes bacterium]|nr:hypothetical protein [Planctomycetota bacterium]